MSSSDFIFICCLPDRECLLDMGRKWGMLEGEIILFTYKFHSDKLKKMGVRKYYEFLCLK